MNDYTEAERRWARDLFAEGRPPEPDDDGEMFPTRDSIQALHETARRAFGKWTAALNPPHDVDGRPIHPGVTPNLPFSGVLAVHLESAGMTPKDVPCLHVTEDPHEPVFPDPADWPGGLVNPSLPEWLAWHRDNDTKE